MIDTPANSGVHHGIRTLVPIRYCPRVLPARRAVRDGQVAMVVGSEMIIKANISGERALRPRRAARKPAGGGRRAATGLIINGEVKHHRGLTHSGAV